MKTPAVSVVLVLAASVSAQQPAADARANEVRWDQAARTHVRSTHIVRGVLAVDSESLQHAIERGGHVKVAVDVREVFHGGDCKTVPFSVYVPKTGITTRSWEWSAEEVQSWHGQDRIVFVMNGWLASDAGADCVLEPTREHIEDVRRREMLHRKLLKQPLQLDRRRQREVRRWMRRICSGKESQHRSFAELEQLGKTHLAELVAAMDDRRRLPDAHITLTNKARDRFEATRTYGVVQVVDALDAILNQITGENFHLLCDCDDEDRRKAVVRAWNLYARYLQNS